MARPARPTPEKPSAATDKPRRDGAATRRRITETAERLFAQQGFEGVSVRDITEASKVDVGLVNYHFKNKENLFREVLAMRIEMINQERRRLIADVDVVPNDPATVEALLTAFIQPYVGRNPTMTRRLSHYRRLMAVTVNSRRWQADVIEKHYNAVARELAENLARALPDAAHTDIYWALSFMTGALVNGFAETRRIDRLSGGTASSKNPYEVQCELIAYIMGGLCHMGHLATT